MLKNMSIRARLSAVIAFLSIEVLLGAFIGIYSLSLSNEAMRSIYDEQLIPTGHLDRIVRLIDENQLLISKAISGDQALIDDTLKTLSANDEKIESSWAAYTVIPKSAEEMRVAEEFVRARQTFINDAVVPARKALDDYDSFGAIEVLHGPVTKLAVPVQQAIDTLITMQFDTAREKFERSQDSYQLVRNTCIAAVIFGLLAAIAVGIWLVRGICQPLDKAVGFADSVAAGNLTQEITVDSHNETGRLMLALRNMNKSLADIVAQVRTGTENMTTASAEIAAGNADLSARTEQQASSLGETASSMDELTSTVRQNSDNARQANQLAQSAAVVAKRGGEVVSKVVDTMGSINDSSRKIVDIISVIDGIAFQTNILALNAAVEAARAGEEGRGFAVVAAEVRNLAQRSAAAAKEIKLLIDTSVEKVHTGASLVNEAGTTMHEIVSSIERVADIMGEITAATEEQTTGIEQVNKSIAQMDIVTQQNAALVEEAAATAQAMRDHAGALQQAVSLFRVDSAMQPVSMQARPALQAASSKKAISSPPAQRAPATHPKVTATSMQGNDWEEF